MRDAYSKTRECLNEERQTREKVRNQAFDQFRRVAIKSISKFLKKTRIAPMPPNISELLPAAIRHIIPLSRLTASPNCLSPPDSFREDTTGEMSETCGSVRVPILPGDEDKPHVLIVDDDEINLKLLSLMVQRENCQVTTAHSGTLVRHETEAAASQYLIPFHYRLLRSSENLDISLIAF